MTPKTNFFVFTGITIVVQTGVMITLDILQQNKELEREIQTLSSPMNEADSSSSEFK
jgi:hypothetical protein